MMDSRSAKASKTMAPFRHRACSNVFAVIAVICCLLLSVSLTGCDGIKYIPVSGQVKLDGKPVAGCAILLVPVAGGPAANATTDAEGHFELFTVNHPGAIAGEYAVTITKQNTNDVLDRATGNRHLQIEWLTPQKYSRPETSGIRKTVSDREHEFLVELSSK
jgi:hypothetical protein